MQTTNLGKLLLAVALAMAATTATHANLLINGSFEQPTAFGPGQWGIYSSIPGWTAVGAYAMEIGHGSTYGVTGYDGNNVMEMDAYGNVMVDQIVGTSGGSYTLSFLYAQRSGVSPTSGSFEVWWNGGLVVSLAPTSTVMALYSTTVIGNAVNTLELRGTGTQDQLGALIDDVQLAAVPEPSTFVAGALLALPFGLQGIRYLRSRRTIS